MGITRQEEAERVGLENGRQFSLTIVLPLCREQSRPRVQTKMEAGSW